MMLEQYKQIVEQNKSVLDTVSLATLVATFVGWLPHIASLLTVVWIGLRVCNELLDRKIKKRTLNELKHHDDHV